MQQEISYEYIRGLIEGEASFSFHSGTIRKDGTKYKMPAFYLSMHVRDKDLLKKIRDKLGLKNRVYAYKSNGFSKCTIAVLSVRDFLQLKDIIIPLCYKKLNGYKGQQFMIWLESIGRDPCVSNRFQSLYRLYAWGIYDEPKFINKYIDRDQSSSVL